MAYLEIEVRIYDPALPFQTAKCENPDIDTWHDKCLLTKTALAKLPHITEKGRKELKLSGGMSIEVPYVEIGLQVGSLRIDAIEALIVEHGHHELVLGRVALENALNVARNKDEGVRVTSASKDDVTALSMELYPVHPPVELRRFEQMIRGQRQLHNIGLIATGEIQMPTIEELSAIIDNDETIPEPLRLRLTWIDTGSIWLTLKSGSEKTLKYVASMFQKGASAKLAQEVAAARKNETEAGISEATREATIHRILSEQEELKAENISKTFDHWRDETRKRIEFFDEVLKKVSDKKAAAALKAKRDQVLLNLGEQQLMPIVRNVPRPYEPPEGVLLLPPPRAFC